MSRKKKAAGPGVGARTSDNRKIMTPSFSHITEAMYIAIFEEGRFVGLRRFAGAADARAALRENGGLA